MTPTVYAVKLRTFGGEALEAIAIVEDDGSLTIVTDDNPGFWSAHVTGAYSHFQRTSDMGIEHHYTDSMGRKRVMTSWYRR
ncbi:hypothetical protein ACWCPQ_14470 [Nocardia sp. NPDC001965]